MTNVKMLRNCNYMDFVIHDNEAVTKHFINPHPVVRMIYVKQQADFQAIANAIFCLSSSFCDKSHKWIIL